MEQKNDVNYIILMKIFAGRNDIENAIFDDETNVLMYGFETFIL